MLNYPALHRASQIFMLLHATLVARLQDSPKEVGCSAHHLPSTHRCDTSRRFRRIPDLVCNLMRFEIGYRIQIRMPTLKRTRPQKAHCGSRMGIVACFCSSSFRWGGRSFARTASQHINLPRQLLSSPFSVPGWGLDSGTPVMSMARLWSLELGSWEWSCRRQGLWQMDGCEP